MQVQKVQRTTLTMKEAAEYLGISYWHMELSCDVRWWDNYTVWLFLGIRLSVEKSAVKPIFVDLIFYLIRFIKL